MAFITPTTGTLRDKVHFECEVEGPNVGGVTGTTWNVFAPTRNAAILPTRGGDAIIAGRMEGKASYDLWIRYDALGATIQAGYRAVNDRTGETYALGAPVDPEGGRKRWLLIQATSNGPPKPGS